MAFAWLLKPKQELHLEIISECLDVLLTNYDNVFLMGGLGDANRWQDNCDWLIVSLNNCPSQIIIPYTIAPGYFPLSIIDSRTIPAWDNPGKLALEQSLANQFYSSTMIKIFSLGLPGFKWILIQHQMKVEFICYALICGELRLTFREMGYWHQSENVIELVFSVDSDFRLEYLKHTLIVLGTKLLKRPWFW